VTTLADLTTLRIGGPIGRLIETTSEKALIAAVTEADAAREPVLVLGRGSNVVAGDAGFPGLVVRDARAEITVTDASACAGTSLTVTAGTPWDDVVARAVDEGWVGVETLSGIPGSTGATPVQNVGAYGQEVAQSIALVRTWDRGEARVRTMALVDLHFSYRDSVLKRSLRAPDGAPSEFAPTPRHVVLDVTFQLRLGTLSDPIRYPELARALGVEVAERVPLGDVRAAVLALRAGKGMLLDPADHDTWSVGSFFTNPLLSTIAAARLPAEAPRFPADDGLTKTSAAWLIEHAGFGPGFGLPGPAALSTKHTLAITNRGGATSAGILALAREMREGVRVAFGVELVPEPLLVGCTLDD
jgi:UDP-N-acetylmuramate dehydrogenase